MRKVTKQARRLRTAFGTLTAVACFTPAARAQSSIEPSSGTAAAPAVVNERDPEPADPTATPRLVVEDPRREVPQHRRPHGALLFTGLVVLAGSYGASAIVGANSERHADERLFLPVVGPWLDLKSRDCGVNVCDNEGVNKAWLIGDGALQGLSALSILLSLVIPEPRERPWYTVGSQKLYVVPQVGLTSGLSAAGEF